MLPMQLQNLKLLLLTFWRRFIYKKIHKLIFDLDLGVKVTGNVAQYPLHYVACATAKFEVATPNS